MAGSIEVIDLGDTVLCDLCSTDHTHSPAKGGFLFSSKGVCPICAPAFEESVKKYGEEEYIKARAADGETFGDFIRRIRGDNNKVIIQTFDSPEEFFEAMEKGAPES